MVEIIIGMNDKGQRLDRFLRKYYKKASLNHIYKLIRKDVKVNGKRAKEQTMLNEGDVLSVYIDRGLSLELQGMVDDQGDEIAKKSSAAKRQFKIAYEDDDVIIVEKPFGLLTHGDGKEKKNTLVNQVIDYLIEKGDYVPRVEKTFRPASIGRLDRNTTGLVIFGKTAEAQREYNRLMKVDGAIEKYYETIVYGRVKAPLHLKDMMKKDEEKNQSHVLEDGKDGKLMETIATPIKVTGVGEEEYSLLKVQLVTGRTHQIRLHLANAGYPIIGDSKYGDIGVNKKMKKDFGLTSQLLHCRELVFKEGPLAGEKVEAARPDFFKSIERQLFKRQAR